MLDAEGLVGALDVHEGHSGTLVGLVGGSTLLARGGEELDTLDASIPAKEEQTIPNLEHEGKEINVNCRWLGGNRGLSNERGSFSA